MAELSQKRIVKKLSMTDITEQKLIKSDFVCTEKPLISVIIPVYNSGRYLERCLRSIIEQSYANLEIIVVNDGSTDGSLDIIDRFAKSDNRLLVFTTKNQGASLARKFGLDQAKGEYVTFVDSDDYVEMRYVESLYEMLNRNICDISSCGTKGKTYSLESVRDITSSLGRVIEEDELFSRFFKYEFWGFWGKLYKRSLFENIIFPKATLCEDYFVMCQLFYRIRKMSYTSEEMYCWNLNYESLSHAGVQKNYFDEFENVSAVYYYVKNKLPRYKRMAQNIVIESCVKILDLTNGKEKKSEILHQRKEVKEFLRSHMGNLFLPVKLPVGIWFKAIRYLF